MKRVLVTGANKGIGLAIVKRLLREYPDVYIYLGSRDSNRGRKAIEQSISEIGEQVKERLELIEIDVTSDSSVNKAAKDMQKNVLNNTKFLYGIVNNAGGTGSEMSGNEIIQLNMYGVRRVTEAFLPFIQNGGRIVQVSSGSAPMFLQKCNDDIKYLLANKPDLEWEEVERNVIQSALDITQHTNMTDEDKAQMISQKGLGELGGMYFYGLAKACVNAYTFSLSNKNPNIKMNSCSPGFIETDLTRPFAERSGKTPAEMGMLPVEKGTIAPVHLLMNDVNGNGWYYGSDGLRSPMHKYRSPGDPEYDGLFP